MDSAEQAVTAMAALDDAQLAQAVAAACAGRPALAELRRGALEAAARLWGTRPTPPPGPVPGRVLPDVPVHDVPVHDVPSAPHPDVAVDKLVDDPAGPDPVTGRAWAAHGAAELDAESPEGRASAAAWDERARAGRARLEEIRRGMAGSD